MSNSGLTLIKYATAIMLIVLWGGAQAADNPISISVYYGQKYLDQSDWEPVESQSEIGVGMTYQQPDLPVIWVGNLLRSSDTGTDTTIPASPAKASGKTTQLSGGARKNFTEGSTKVFAEGGLLLASITLKDIDAATGLPERTTGSALGLWLGGGLDAMLTPVISVGGLIRISQASKQNFSFGGTHFGLYAAFHFQP